MKIKSVILDTTTPTSDSVNPSLWTYNNTTLLDYQIKKIQDSGRTPIIVIGQEGDELLRKCPRLDECDLVFNPEQKMETGIYAGLHGTGACAFYLPVQIPYPKESIWLELEKNYIQLPYQHEFHILKPQMENTPYPLLITKLGRDTILGGIQNSLLDLSHKFVPVDIANALDN